MHTISNGRKFFISEVKPPVNIKLAVLIGVNKILILQVHMSEARDYCCKLGMQPAEFYSLTDVQDVNAIINGKSPKFSNKGLEFLILYYIVPGARGGLISEIYVNGRKQNLWCGSNTVISDEVRSTFRKPNPSNECRNPSCLMLYPSTMGMQYPGSSYGMCVNSELFSPGTAAFICQ